jgi:NitT/TauT family transport system permease protein
MTSPPSSTNRRAPTTRDDRLILAGQLVLGIVLLVAWEWAGRTFGATWSSLPSLIAVRLVEWAGTTLAVNLGITIAEIVIGLVVGVSAGIAMGLLLGQSLVFGTIFRPIVVGFYSIPIVTLAPLLILWFGLDMAPKIVLVAISSFFLLFFSTFSGVKAIDRDLILGLRQMGAEKGELFRKVGMPGAMPWIVSGIKIALPYSIAAAVTGELLAARLGMGALLSTAAAQFDMTGLYAALFVLMLLGIAASTGMTALERRLLRWRPGER